MEETCHNLFIVGRERLKEVEKRARDAFKEKAKTVRENVRERSDTGIVRYKETYTRKYGRMISIRSIIIGQKIMDIKQLSCNHLVQC